MQSAYQSLAERAGDIYIGVVGPVRTGKSTFIRRFMETLAIPGTTDEETRRRMIDEQPQSAAGRTIMTTEPKFVPEEGAQVEFDGGTANVRLIDCVGYIVPSAIGYIEEEAPRMVRTPWFDEPVPFNMAAEIGTRKVITDHSTVGVVVTTDGSISDIPRGEYAEAEARVIRELQAIGKPFAILLNCVDPYTRSAESLRAELEETYGTPVLCVSCAELDTDRIRGILNALLREFPVRHADVSLPGWVVRLPEGHRLKQEIYGSLRGAFAGVKRLRELDQAAEKACGCALIRQCRVAEVEPSGGSARIELSLPDELFYQVLEEQTGLSIPDEGSLMSTLSELAESARAYERLRGALDEVEATGYGIVLPGVDEMQLAEPEITKQGGRYGVRLQATATSIHMLRADITTEVAPIVGSEKQSQELVEYLLKEFEDDPKKLWESNIFGKSLNELVNEGLHNKLYRMPAEARLRLQETVERIINEGCSGLICIML